MNDFIILTSVDDQELASSIAKIYKCQVSIFNELTFSDGEIEIESVKPYRKILLVYSLYPNIHEKLFRLILTIRTLKACGAESVFSIIPYMPYSRQDKASSYSPVNIITTTLLQSGLDKLITIDLHGNSLLTDFPNRIYNISLTDFYAEQIRDSSASRELYAIASVDAGATRKCEKIAKLLNYELVTLHKIRNAQNSIDFQGEIIADKHYLIIDDIVDSACTVCSAASFLKEHGATAVSAYITHGVFSGRRAKKRVLTADFSKFYITDTINLVSWGDTITVNDYIAANLPPII